ncbi:hypothetical protein [Nitrosomonas oligotropha]|uniref:Uncharacterized protein n=1 Tax=Nitrosomonas oligotropha TaxID=42354 RepID=A0A1H8PER7_9PROT|nr:hypothetical protein [Nitrosomonas oligotropha]SDW77377.1 hypothetical protein SAMN05216300_11056 [Nitrosomonas oligotropha]SEO40043.1 hypothetical protein SAMN05216333_10956 [Nitrosomonas oligotropha]
MKKTELAKALGISRQAIYKFLWQGMPGDDLQAAIDWREKNLNYFRTKKYRTGLAAARERLEAERRCKIR